MTINEKKENEVYILGSESANKKRKSISTKFLLITGITVLMIITGMILNNRLNNPTPEYYFEPELKSNQSISLPVADSVNNMGDDSYIKILEETVNDVPLIVYLPQNASLSLQVGMPDKSDTSIVFAAMAADIRKDNMQIVGDFVLSGKQLARGVAKKGFVAIEDHQVTIGMGESTPLLKRMIENKGSFFRQYPLVHNGAIIENKIKNKSIRRALAVRNENILMVESKNRESFYDFSNALLDIGITDAIYLVGGNAYGWYYNKERVRYEFGIEQPDIPDNISYIIWR